MWSLEAMLIATVQKHATRGADVEWETSLVIGALLSAWLCVIAMTRVARSFAAARVHLFRKTGAKRSFDLIQRRVINRALEIVSRLTLEVSLNFVERAIKTSLAEG